MSFTTYHAIIRKSDGQIMEQHRNPKHLGTYSKEGYEKVEFEVPDPTPDCDQENFAGRTKEEVLDYCAREMIKEVTAEMEESNPIPVPYFVPSGTLFRGMLGTWYHVGPDVDVEFVEDRYRSIGATDSRVERAFAPELYEWDGPPKEAIVKVDRSITDAMKAINEGLNRQVEEEKQSGELPDTETRVIEEIKKRQQKGISKYGKTVAQNPLGLYQWSKHFQEELLDGVVYLTRAMQEIEKDLPAIEYAIQLQKAIETHCRGREVDEDPEKCPHHAEMLNKALSQKVSQKNRSLAQVHQTRVGTD